MTEAERACGVMECLSVLASAGAKWIDEALRDNPDGPITAHTTRTKTEVKYEVTIGFSSEVSNGRLIWWKTVPFGNTDAHCAGGAAFVAAALEQDHVSLAALNLMELRRGGAK